MLRGRALFSVGSLVLVACAGSDSGTPPTNTAPVLSLATTEIAVSAGFPFDLAVTATDADDDPLTITWSITRGSLTPQNSARTVMEWSVPATVGVDTVRVSATDGTHTRSIKAGIRVGTRVPGPFLPITLTKANSPYIISPPDTDPVVTARTNNTTTIQAGVELFINTEVATISVLGRLEAHGTEDEPIVIRPNNRTFNCGADRGWWEGIRGATDDAVSSDGFVDFEYVEIWDARWGVRIRDQANALLRNCSIRCSGDAGVLVEGSGSLQAFDSRMSDGLGDGIAISALSSLPDSVRVEGCTIAFNVGIGIRMDLEDHSQLVPIVVEFNTIEFNETHGISLANAVFPSIHFNAFLGNGDASVSNLFLFSNYPDPVNLPQLNAACNFWGSAAGSQATIDASIRDSLDTSTVHTRVISSPWLNLSPITTPPTCTP